MAYDGRIMLRGPICRMAPFAAISLAAISLAAISLVETSVSRISLYLLTQTSSRMKVLTHSTFWSSLAMAVVVGGTVGVVTHQVTPLGGWPGAVVAVLVAMIALRRPFRRWRRSRMPLEKERTHWLFRNVPLYRKLDAEGRQRFERDVQFVLDEYSFEGVKGLEVGDDLRLSVAAGVACLLHGRPEWELPGTKNFLFYPDRFDDDYYGGAYASYDGMAHEQGPTILTAASVEHSWAASEDGDNVVLHELAHHFDFDNVTADGVPSLIAPESASAWQSLVHREMDRVETGQSILRPYAAEAPSEFFAVSTEVFFEQPHQMHDEHPELFKALSAFYQIDPRTGKRSGEG